MKPVHATARTFLLCGAFLLSAYAALFMTRLTIGVLIDLLVLPVADAVIATTSAELVARVLACGVILWKLSSVMSEATTAPEAWALVKARSTLFALALFVTLFLSMDQRVFWWVQYVTGGVVDYSRAAQTVHQSAFTACAVNCITLLLCNFRTWRGAALGFGWLSFVTAGGFIAALWWRGVV